MALLALAGLKGVGYWTLYNIKKDGISFNHLLNCSESAKVMAVLRKHGAKIENPSTNWTETSQKAANRAARQSEEFQEAGIEVIFADDVRFPSSLLELDDPPEWLFVRGSLTVLSEPSITAVGTRKPTPDGNWLSHYVGLNFADWDAPTVSGLATGMDQAVHNFSLRMKVPTIAILGTGIQTEYPKGSNYLADKIVDNGGAIMTEYLPNESYSGENFVRRNRLQAALGKVLIPIEWASKSGTAHTVNYASRLKRPIAGLKLSDWEPERVSLPRTAQPFSRVFCIPRDQTALTEFIKKSLSAPSRKTSEQLPLI